ncbi:MAG: methylated-DNA--[protein]-cysteine S-methyltransferase [Holophagae bacterium]|nr:methylated-DNA--[protein]-cysteine S-methyltransferase [Holophagae bacterium]
MPNRSLYLELTEREEQLVRLEFRRGIMPPTGPSPSPLLRNTARELHAYFDGKLEEFSIPLKVEGTAFQTSVWSALQEVPYGQAVSYGDLAEQIGKPKAARAIGGAVGKNPIPIIIPCHRVLAAGGKLGGFTGGTDIKKWFLAIEGIRR